MNNNPSVLSVSTDVLEKMTEIATKEIEGVAGLAKKAIDIRKTVKNRHPFKAVKVESVNGALKINVYICVEQNVIVKDVAEKVQANVKEKIQTMTNTAVTKVNVYVSDVKISTDEAAE